MYEFVSLFNSFVREQLLPNPFEYMFQDQITAILVFALFGGKILNDIAYTMCGVFYKSRSNKTLGSIGYMFFYCVNVQVLIKLWKYFQDIKLVISFYMIFVTAMFIVLCRMKRIINQI